MYYYNYYYRSAGEQSDINVAVYKHTSPNRLGAFYETKNTLS